MLKKYLLVIAVMLFLTVATLFSEKKPEIIWETYIPTTDYTLYPWAYFY